MSILMAIFTFINAWWVSLFFILPLSIEKDASTMPQDYAAAPKAPNWKKKIWQTTLVAGSITAMLALVIGSGIVQVK